MLGRRADRRRAGQRAFQPTLDGRLETRLLMKVGKFGDLYPAGHIQTAFGGQAVDITTSTGQSFFVVVSTGQVRAYAMPGGRFGLTVSGTDNQSILSINPIIDSKVAHTGHVQNNRQSAYNGMINIGAINITDGQINSVLGYKTAVLSGPLFAFGTNPIDRIAFDQIAPGASIITGGDVNTLDVFGSVILSGAGTGINIGRDLNTMNVGGDLDIANGAFMNVTRYVGLTPQPAKGTGPAPLSAAGFGFNLASIGILGNFILNNGVFSAFGPVNPILAEGPVVGANNIHFTVDPLGQFAVLSPVGVFP